MNMKKRASLRDAFVYYYKRYMCLPGKIETYADNVVMTVVDIGLDTYGCRSVDGAVLIEGVHIAEVNIEQPAGVDTYAATERVA